MNPVTLRAEQSAVPASDAREELERVLACPSFQRSPQSQRFLRYVCEMELKGEGSRINEYLLGFELFSRGSQYSTSEDAVVRRSAHAVRRKLDAYYANEGRQNPVRIEIPIGHYQPAFKWQEAEFRPPAWEPEATTRRFRWRVAAAILACVATAFLGWALGRSYPAPTPVPVGTAEIWGPWLSDPETVSLVFANSKTAVVHHVPDENLRDRHPLHFSLPPEADQEFRAHFGFASGGYVYMRPSDLKTAIAESTSGVQLGQFFGRWSVPVRATQSRLVNWESLRRGRHIFLGHNEANPWVDKLLAGYPMRLGDSQGIQRFIAVDEPKDGELARYAKEARSGNEPITEYALVSMLPGYQAGSSILLISGLDGQATQLAAEYLTRESSLLDLAQKLRNLDPSHAGQWWFQFVLKAEVRDKVATRSEVSVVRLVRPRR